MTRHTVGGPARAGAFVYAHDIGRLSAFYAGVVGMTVRSQTPERHVLASPDFQLIVQAMPPEVTASVLASPPVMAPPEPSQRSAVKLFFTVASLAAAD